jgi:hypothetical protein
MASNTKNVKLGVCKLFYDGVDLGYTQGGVEVSVKTDTHKVNIDQYGKTAINELLMGRDISAKTNLAETTLDNLVAIMPGASLVVVGGSAASGTITVATLPVAGDTIVINGTTVTFRAALTGVGVESLIGGTAALTGPILAAALNASTDPGISAASYSAAAAVITATYGNQLVYGVTGAKSTDGNAFTLVTGTAGAKVTMSAATLTGGAEPTSKRVDVAVGIGIDLLSIAKELRLHPINKAATDLSDDFVIPLAASSGGLNFAYKLESERVYSAEFGGYPDPVTGRLFYIGQ